MTFGSWLAVARDVLILAALGFLLWFVTHAEHNADELKNIKATLAQTQKWQEGQTSAATTASNSLKGLNDRLDALDQRGPVIVRIPVPAASASAKSPVGTTPYAGPSACPAGSDVRSVDIRPVLERPERAIATAMIGCQQLLDAWPK